MKTRTCTKCKTSYARPKQAFQKEKHGKDGLRSVCRKCRLEMQRSYRSTSPKAKHTLKAGVLRRRKRNREFVRDYLLTHPCVDCGESRWQVLEFDHVKKKRDNIAWMIIRARSLKTIETEIAKCEVRCANCHRLKTAIQFGWYAT